MPYTPIVPTSGLGGWKVLQRTMDRQMKAFSDSAEVKRDLAYFKEHIGEADTPEKLVGDRKLLKVALGAFGLGSEINKKAYIRKMLEEGTDDRKSFANRTLDSHWREMVGAFGYGDKKGAQVAKTAFVDEVARSYKIKSFEEAVGAVDNSQRMAMNFDRQIKTMAVLADLDGDAKNDLQWMRALGDKPLRAVLEQAFGLPSSFVKLDIDQQVTAIKEKAVRVMGTDDFSKLKDDDVRDKLVRRFFVQQSIKSGPTATTPGFSALSILQNGGAGSANLFQSLLR